MNFISVKKVCFASYASLLQFLTVIQHVDQLYTGAVSSDHYFYIESCMAEEESLFIFSGD